MQQFEYTQQQQMQGQQVGQSQMQAQVRWRLTGHPGSRPPYIAGRLLQAVLDFVS